MLNAVGQRYSISHQDIMEQPPTAATLVSSLRAIAKLVDIGDSFRHPITYESWLRNFARPVRFRTAPGRHEASVGHHKVVRPMDAYRSITGNGSDKPFARST
jgi:hypothetical protein